MNKMQTTEESKSQFERDLRVIQSNSVEPIVYQSNHSIVSSYGGEVDEVFFCLFLHKLRHRIFVIRLHPFNNILRVNEF